MQSNTSNPPSPSEAELHAGQLEDYELLLATLRETPVNILWPVLSLKPFSPITKVSADGLKALWQVLRDRDYIDMCTRLEIKHGDLSVAFTEGKYVYQTWKNTGHKVTLELTEHAKWQPLKLRIERAAALLGGVLNSNRTIGFERMCVFYGIALTSRDPQKVQATIKVVRDRISSHRLRLEDEFEALDLKSLPTEKDPETFATIQQADTPVDTQLLHRGRASSEIVDAVNQFLPENVTSPLAYLAKDVLSNATIEQVRATPSVYLEKILQSAEAQKLGNTLLTTMDWYGGRTGEETSPYIRTRLIANALQHWLCAQTLDSSDLIAGYDWQTHENWGKSYQAIREAFEAHLLTSKLASSDKEAVVISRLFLSRFPFEFRVRDIQADLAYRSTAVWVNFLNGVNFVKAVAPELLDRLSFQQLVNLPMYRAEVATTEELNLLSRTRLLPTLDWAVTHGFIPQKKLEGYTQADIERACSELEKHSNEVNQAVIRINEEPPKRLSIAKAEVQTLFGTEAFNTDGRKLARYDELASIGFRDTPPLRDKEYKYYSFADVLASGMFDDQKIWIVTEADGETLSPKWIRMDKDRYLIADRPWPVPGPSVEGRQKVLSPFTEIPDVPALFDDAFKRYLEKITTAYQTLIRTLLTSLPHADRLALEVGEVKIYSLRKETRKVAAKDETPNITLPLRARNGVILQATQTNEPTGDEAAVSVSTFYELFPKAGVIRRLENFDATLLIPRIGAMATTSNGAYVDVIRDRHLPFDWDAHSNGTLPKATAFCEAIIDQLPPSLSASSEITDQHRRAPLTLSSSRSMDISRHIATELLFVDPQKLRTLAKGQTKFELEEARRRKTLQLAKKFVPFWGPVEDLMSGDKNRIALGIVGLFFDVISFAIPIGKFVTGSVRLINNAGRLATRATLPSFATLTKTLLVSTLQALNPLEIIPALLKGLGKAVRYIYKAVTFNFNDFMGTIRYYEYVRSLPQLYDAGRWKPATLGDQLASIKGIDDVQIRNIGASGKTDWRLVDPLSSKPYGPPLTTRASDFSPGQSHYRPLEGRNQQSVVELAKTRHVREVLEVDGRTTLFIDDVPYRLEGDTLRRADLIDMSDSLKSIPCRPRRAPGADVCTTSYVTRDPAPTPAVGTFDETKGWATWFGDRIYTPGAADAPLTKFSLATHTTLDATMEFRKGIYGRVKVNVTEKGVTDTFHSGAIIVDSIDGSKRYVFTRLDAGDFYVAELANGQSLRNALTFKQASTLPAELRRELMVVYTGSLNANNMARIYGVGRVERALQAMDNIAIPIGGPANPPDTLKLIKVDTSPGEAVLFDHSTRMIVRHSTDGATTWSASRNAPESVRETTAQVINTLFQKTVITLESSVQGGPKALKIDGVMLELQQRISAIHSSELGKPRNVAFAEIKTRQGIREVYVSVSGRQGDTHYLPLFSRSRDSNEVIIDGTSYFNIDHGAHFPQTSLSVSASGKLRAIPHTIKDVEKYTPELTQRPTSLDTESKLIGVIRQKYPDSQELESITIATTMAPCDSCSIVMKQFGYDGSPEALNVIWK
ncbi:deaminase domain-containing protein [Pseudomonas migulae]|uniref:The BURPS668_1122 family of deaminases n=1 Tax=Pseudomonas migulae TaxID=78543 RepID=A0A1H5M624_9PSED|nr:deaminase domain-containing protein [Pseudomonas migulae]SEE84121.1 The BURPS668_1122 family of deaminases [Pseudomonas migulae]